MFSSPMLLLPSICLLFLFVGQMPSMISGMPAKTVASNSSSNSKSQFSDDCQIMDDVIDFSRNDNKSRAIFDKMMNLDEEKQKCRQQGGDGECKNETLIKEGNKLLDPLFDAFDKNKDAQLDVEEIEKILTDVVAYMIEKTCIEKGAFFQNSENPKKLTGWERKFITEKMNKELLPEMKKQIKEAAEKLVKENDANGDGKLSKEEMEESMKKESALNGPKTMGKKFKRSVGMKFDGWFK